MLSSKQTYNRLKPIIGMMNKSITCQSVVTNANGSYTMLCNYTKWLVEGYTVTILGVNYEVVDVNTDIDITLTGPSQPAVLTFDLYEPIFKHGTLKRVANELNQLPNYKQRLPLIWLQEIVDETLHFDELDAIDTDSDCRLYFCTASDFSNWTQEDGDVKGIQPMRNLLKEFIKVLANNQYVAQLTNTGTVRNMNVFGNQAESGATTNIFNEPLCAVMLRILIPFFKECDCCEDGVLDNRPAPGYVLDVNGNTLAILYSNEYYTVTAGGVCLGVTITDQDGNILTTVASGGNYPVTVFDGIEDTIDNNTVTIIDNLT